MTPLPAASAARTRSSPSNSTRARISSRDERAEPQHARRAAGRSARTSRARWRGTRRRSAPETRPAAARSPAADARRRRRRTAGRSPRRARAPPRPAARRDQRRATRDDQPVLEPVTRSRGASARAPPGSRASQPRGETPSAGSTATSSGTAAIGHGQRPQRQQPHRVLLGRQHAGRAASPRTAAAMRVEIAAR